VRARVWACGHVWACGRVSVCVGVGVSVGVGLSVSVSVRGDRPVLGGTGSGSQSPFKAKNACLCTIYRYHVAMSSHTPTFQPTTGPHSPTHILTLPPVLSESKHERFMRCGNARNRCFFQRPAYPSPVPRTQCTPDTVFVRCSVRLHALFLDVEWRCGWGSRSRGGGNRVGCSLVGRYGAGWEWDQKQSPHCTLTPET
jgi:hypothetical protein